MANQPRSERPFMPGYGISESEAGILPWSWAVERLNRSQNFWLSTTRPDGRPHSMAVWAVWLSGGLYFSTGESTTKSRNLARRADCVVTTDQAAEPVVIEGRAERVAADLSEVLSAYVEKYGMAYPGDSAVYRIEPVVAFGFLEEASRFPSSATRWVFS